MDFFAPWCKACPKAAQKLDDLAQNYSETCDSAVGPLAVALDGVSYGLWGPYNQGIFGWGPRAPTYPGKWEIPNYITLYHVGIYEL